MKKIILLVIFALNVSIVFSQNPDRQFIKYTTDNNFIKIETNDGYYLIRFLNDKIVETNFIPSEESFQPDSHAIILDSHITPEIQEHEDALDFKTPGLCVSIQKSPFQISYDYKERFLLSEKLGYIDQDSLKILNFNISSDDVLYGGGTRVLDMNRRGNKLKLYNRAHYGYETHSELMNYTMPLVFSSKLFAVHFDNAPIGFLDLDSAHNNTLNYETISGRMTYQVIADDTWRGMMSTFTGLTGRQTLPPLWAFGNFSSRFGYHSQKETEQTVALFQEKEIPLDAVIIDIYWFGKGIFNEMGNLNFYKDSFPEPKRMIEEFRTKGIKTVLVTEPFILTTSKRWDEAVAKDILVKDTLGQPKTWDFYFGNTSLVDIYNPKGAQWFWNIYKHFTEMGVSGWWGDLGEPEVHPSDALHFTGTADEVHNIYGHDWAKLIYKGFQKNFPDTRPFILMRAGAVGSQRYGMIPWSGDVNRTWGGLQAQTEIALQMGMQGIGYMHSDLGGFAGENLDDELYSRWLQYGVFQPIFRPHGQEEVASEPVYRSEKVQKLAKKSIELRYQLLPYTYTLAFQNSQKGMPFSRPLFFAEPENTDLLTYKDCYLWGDAFLIAPVVKPNLSEMEVYFPKDANWYDFYNYKSYKGGSKQIIQLEEDHIPTFVKGGSFIPMVPIFQNTEHYNLTHLDVHLFYDASVNESTYELYSDDGKTPNALDKSMFETTTFTSKQEKKWFEISVKPDYGVVYTPYKKHIDIIIHNLNKQPKKVKINGKKVAFDYNKKNEKELIIPIVIEEFDVTIKIKF